MAVVPAAAAVVAVLPVALVCSDAGGALPPDPVVVDVAAGFVATTDAGVFFSDAWVASTKAGGFLPEPSPGCVLSNGSIFFSVSLRVVVWVVVEGVEGVTMVFTVDGG